MDVIYYIFAATVATAALLAGIAIWAPRKTPIRATALVAMTLFLPIAYAQFIGLLAKPMPVAWAWIEQDVDRAEVLSVSFDEGKRIYMWLRLDGMIEPRFYSLPWRQSDAEDLEDAMEQANKFRGKVIVKDPFSKQSLEERGGISVEIIPPAMQPPKTPFIAPKAYNPRSPEI